MKILLYRGGGMFGSIFKAIFGGGKNEKIAPKGKNVFEGQSKAQQKIMIKCNNCGHVTEKKPKKIIFVCEKCGFSRTLSWRDYGIDVESSGTTILSNPNPQKASFGTKRRPFEQDFSIDYNMISPESRAALKEALEAIEIGELSMFHSGECPAPRPYRDVAVLARKSKYYDLEIAICKRVSEIASEHDRIAAGIDSHAIRFSHTSANDVIERLPKAIALRDKAMKAKAEDANKKEQPKSSPAGKATTKRAPKGPTLDDQCAELGIDILEMTIPCEGRKYTLPDGQTTTKPEEAVLACLKNEGYVGGTFYELHPIMQVIQGCCLEYLQKKCSHLYMEDYRARTFSVQVSMYNLDENHVLRLVSGKSPSQLFTAWENVYYMSKSLKDWFPRIDREGMKAVLQAMHGGTLEEITRYIMQAPDVASVGWPDIFAVRNGKIRLFEVKVKDKLLDTQLYTIPNLAKPMGFDVKVVRVTKG